MVGKKKPPSLPPPAPAPSELPNRRAITRWNQFRGGPNSVVGRALRARPPFLSPGFFVTASAYCGVALRRLGEARTPSPLPCLRKSAQISVPSSSVFGGCSALSASSAFPRPASASHHPAFSSTDSIIPLPSSRHSPAMPRSAFDFRIHPRLRNRPAARSFSIHPAAAPASHEAPRLLPRRLPRRQPRVRHCPHATPRARPRVRPRISPPPRRRGRDSRR